MIDSFRYQLMQEILRELQQDVTFEVMPGDKCQPIKPRAIQFRKVSVKLLSQNQGFTFEQAFPGIVLSTPFEEPFNPNTGTNERDEYIYHWLIQIIDSDNHEPTANVRTYWKWQEQIRHLLQFNCPSRIDSQHVLSKCTNVDVVDESKWLKDENFVCGVHVAVQVWESRGPT